MPQIMKLLLGLLLIVVLLVGGATLLARRHDRAVLEEWARTLGPLEDVERRHPPVTNSEGAWALEAGAAALGIAKPPAGPPARTLPTDESRAAWEAVAKAVGAHVGKQVRRADDGIDPPPPDVAKLYRRNKSVIHDVESTVIASGPIVWETDLRRFFEAPIPGLFTYRQLHSVFLLDALERKRAGDEGGVSRALDAAWKVSGSLSDRSELISQLVAMALDDNLFGVLRRVGTGERDWPQRLRERSYRRTVSESFMVEAWMLREYTQTHPSSFWLLRPTGLRGRLYQAMVDPLAAPYIRYCGSELVDDARRSIVRLRATDPCALTPATLTASVDAIPAWNVVARTSMPSLVRGWISASRIDLDADATIRILEAKAGGSSLGAPVPSAVCSGLKWSTRASEDGALTIAPLGTVPDGPGLPLEFTLRKARTAE
jgi:hypothetical protein